MAQPFASLVLITFQVTAGSDRLAENGLLVRKCCLGLGLAAVLATGCGHFAPPVEAATPSPTPSLAAPAPSIVFDGDSYFMADDTSGKGTQSREFLLDGQTFDDYTRKITFRLWPGKDLRAFEKVYLAQLESSNPGYVQRVYYRSRKAIDEDFQLTGEYQLWSWRLTPRGIEGFEFKVRDAKNPARLKALVTEKQMAWRKDLERAAKMIPSILKP